MRYIVGVKEPPEDRRAVVKNKRCGTSNTVVEVHCCHCDRYFWIDHRSYDRGMDVFCPYCDETLEI